MAGGLVNTDSALTLLRYGWATIAEMAHERDSRLVYSTQSGDHRRDRPGGPPDRRPANTAEATDGFVRIFREKSGRGGKVVTVIRGLPVGELAGVASDLKRHCGSGGAVKGGAVEIQGDHREKIARKLETQGHRVKLAGG